uniref:uncharacterized protein LOC120348041 n=1 Tax=Styela clava TaxID=7725 RepID=UPI00193A8469|nr:uncharacterized protein LOC120348041 [Styela clava]
MPQTTGNVNARLSRTSSHSIRRSISSGSHRTTRSQSLVHGSKVALGGRHKMSSGDLTNASDKVSAIHPMTTIIDEDDRLSERRRSILENEISNTSYVKIQELALLAVCLITGTALIVVGFVIGTTNVLVGIIGIVVFIMGLIGTGRTIFKYHVVRSSNEAGSTREKKGSYTTIPNSSNIDADQMTETLLSSFMKK